MWFVVRPVGAVLTVSQGQTPVCSPAEFVYITTPRTIPDSLLRLIWYRWSIDSGTGFASISLMPNTATGEFACVLAMLRTAALNLVCSAEFGSIRQVLHAVMHHLDIRPLLAIAMRKPR